MTEYKKDPEGESPPFNTKPEDLNVGTRVRYYPFQGDPEYSLGTIKSNPRIPHLAGTRTECVASVYFDDGAGPGGSILISHLVPTDEPCPHSEDTKRLLRELNELERWADSKELSRLSCALRTWVLKGGHK